MAKKKTTSRKKASHKVKGKPKESIKEELEVKVDEVLDSKVQEEPKVEIPPPVKEKTKPEEKRVKSTWDEETKAYAKKYDGFLRHGDRFQVVCSSCGTYVNVPFDNPACPGNIMKKEKCGYDLSKV